MDVLTLHQLSRITGYSRQHLWRLVCQGKIPVAQRVGTRRVILVPATPDVLASIPKRRRRVRKNPGGD